MKFLISGWSVTPPCRTRLVNENRFIVFDKEKPYGFPKQVCDLD